jgi:hypothetical protein
MPCCCLLPLNLLVCYPLQLWLVLLLLLMLLIPARTAAILHK